jgi:hypothetical protein
MSQLLVSGYGYLDHADPIQEQYRPQQDLLPYDPLFRPDYLAHPTPSSAIRELHRTGETTWNKTFNLDFPQERREPFENRQPLVVVNYMVKNPSDPAAPTPIPIAQYAVNTGLIYVGPGAGTWGGIQVGTMSGGPSGY